MVILRDPLANLAGGSADNVIDVGVVIGIALKDVNADGAFLEIFGLTFQCEFDHITQEIGITLAVAKCRVREDTYQLLLDGLRVCRVEGDALCFRFRRAQCLCVRHLVSRGWPSRRIPRSSQRTGRSSANAELIKHPVQFKGDLLTWSPLDGTGLEILSALVDSCKDF